MTVVRRQAGRTRGQTLKKNFYIIYLAILLDHGSALDYRKRKEQLNRFLEKLGKEDRKLVLERSLEIRTDLQPADDTAKTNSLLPTNSTTAAMAGEWVKLEPSCEQPEIIYPGIISLQQHEKCADACKALLAAILAGLDRKYRLELYPVYPERGDDRWNLRVKLDAVEWFDRVLFKKYNGDLTTTATIARQFVDNTYNELRSLPEVDPPERPSHDPKADCSDRNCPSYNICTYTKPLSDGANRACRFFFQEDFVVCYLGQGTLSRQLISWIGDCTLQNSREAIQDLLLMPPLITARKNVPHQTNRKMVEDAQVWKIVSDIYTILQKGREHPMLEGIAANFGKWGIANSRNTGEHVLDCHGHERLLLSRLTIDPLSEEPGCRGLIGQVNHPNTHLEEDCRELETHRLQPLENQIFRNSLQTVNERLDQLQDKTAKEFQTLNEKLFDIKSLLEQLVARMEPAQKV